MNEMETQIALAALTEQVKAGFANTDRSMQHMTNELSEIKSEVKRTNGRVTTLEKIDAARSAGNAATAAAESRVANMRDDQVVTLTTAKNFAQFGGWVVAGILGLLKLIGKL